jgi:DNA-binding CsgD family transcriptional regulator
MELAYGGLHQLCAPMLDLLDGLPAPQRDALGIVFGLSAGPAPDRFLVGLATLTLFAEIAEQQPLLCVVDDAQWLDQASGQVIGFVARRLLAERIAIVCAARTGIGDAVLADLPELEIRGLAESDARTLLLENLTGALDAAVCAQIVAESHGNPLALLELPRTWNPAELAGGFGVPGGQRVGGKIERSYSERLLQLPPETQLLVLAAAAEPLGDPLLLHRASQTLGLDSGAADPAIRAGLLAINGRVEFAHPLVRSAAYQAGSSDDRRRVHDALAEATDPDVDPDRRAWHRARAVAEPNEDVAAELERAASRAQARGGIAAAAAFLERAAALSSDPAHRARRALAAAEAKQLAGAPQAASALLAAAMDVSLDERAGGLARRLKGQIALDLRRVGEAVPSLLDAACRLEPIDAVLARATYLEALRAATISGRLGEGMLRRVADAAASAMPASSATRAADVLFAGLVLRFTDGYAASADLLTRAVIAVRDEDGRVGLDIRWPGFARVVALEMFDDETCHVLCARGVQLARERGALGVLPLALTYFATLLAFEGDLDGAEALLDESDGIADATGARRVAFARWILAGFRGDEAAVSRLVETSEHAVELGEGSVLTSNDHARTLLYNGLGRYETAFASAQSASETDELTVSVWSLPELVESAIRSGRHDVASHAGERLTERAQAAGTEWALGLDARCRALLSDGTEADDLYREAVDRLGRCRIATDRARAHLLYGEWLRRESRRAEAREQLRTAYDMLSAIGMQAFAERARRELLATGETVRKRTADTRDQLTPQEEQIARLARDGLTNPEIGSQLFISARTVEWHLRKVFAKLEIASRKELQAALRDGEPLAFPA